MLAAQKNSEFISEAKRTAKVRTTLYDLIAAVQEELQPGEEELGGIIIGKMLEKYGARFEGSNFRGALALK